MATCKSCEAEIDWATTEAGKAMPLDAKPDPGRHGLWVVINGKVRQATPEDDRLRRPRRSAHWATCPQAAQHRRAP